MKLSPISAGAGESNKEKPFHKEGEKTNNGRSPPETSGEKIHCQVA